MKNILEYQKLDMELIKLLKNSDNNEDKKTMNKMIGFVKDAQTKSLTLECQAKKLSADYNNLKKSFDNNTNKVQQIVLDSQNITNQEDIDKLYGAINTLSSELFMIERNLNIVIKSIKDNLKEFEITKNNVIKAKSKYKDSKAKYDQEISVNAPKINELKTKLHNLEKTIDKSLFDKYKTMKNDNIFPVFVTINDKRCYCRTEIPSGKLDILRKEGSIHCEQCRRIIIDNK